MCYLQVAQVAVMAISLIAGAGEAQAQKQTGKANQQIAEQNARMAEQQGHDAQVLAVRDQQQSAWRTRALIGQQKTQAAANGLDIDSGTPLDIMSETAAFGQADEAAIGLDAARKAWGFQGEATNSRNQGTLANWQGKQAAKATYLKTFSSALSSAASMKGSAGNADTVSSALRSGSGITTIATGRSMAGYA